MISLRTSAPCLALSLLPVIFGCSSPAEETTLHVPADRPNAAAALSGETRYIVVGRSQQLPAQFESNVAAAGGRLLHRLDAAGIAYVSAAEASFGGRLAASGELAAVLPALPVKTATPTEEPPSALEDDFLYNLQWSHAAMDTPSAWAAGARGQGVRVAVVDTGISNVHPDLAANLNQDLSISFVPGMDPYAELSLPRSHGTEVAGSIAAADNGFGLIGVAPDAELISVKVLSEDTLQGDIFTVVAGIFYSADIGAPIANVSLVTVLDRNGMSFDPDTPDDPSDDVFISAEEIAMIIDVVQLGLDYAWEKGTLVVTAAGNDGLNFDGETSLVVVPGGLERTLDVSATGPQGWALNPATDLDRLAFYSNTGKQLVDVAAPGGNVDFELFESGQICTVAFVTQPCAFFDLLPVATPTDFMLDAGTSLSAAHVSGIAALIHSVSSQPLRPSQVVARLRKSSDDLGPKNRDSFYGSGRVNAAKAIAE